MARRSNTRSRTPGPGRPIGPAAAGLLPPVLRVLLLLTGVLAALLLAPPSAGASGPTREDRIAAFGRVLPEATRFGPVTGEPPAAAAYRDGTLVGYAFLTRDVVASVGFSGKPLDIAVGLSLDGRITGAEIVEHHEPILVIGVSDDDLAAFVAQYRGRDVRVPVRVVRHREGDSTAVDAVAGATTSSLVLNDTILRAARAVARSRGILGGSAGRVDFESYAPADWSTLISEGSLARRRITVAEAMAAVERQGGRLFPEGVAPPDPDATYIDLYLGLATPARVGRNLLGDRLYNRLMADLNEGDQIVFIAANGLYSFKGTRYVRSGTFDRIQLVQGTRTLRFAKSDHVRIDKLTVEGAPELRERAIFRIRRDSGFDPLKDWRLDLFVSGAATGTAAGARSPTAVFSISYALPARYLRQAADRGPETEPVWRAVWRLRLLDIAILGAALVLLTGLLVFQDAVVKRRRLFEALRVAFLAFVVVWLGWYTGAQLSVLNVLTFTEALRTGFRWDFFLIDPLLFVLWSYVAIAMMFLGRGVFCGWLCPFGAMQELLHRLGRRVGLPRVRLPFTLHERLWPVKYIAFVGLFALSLSAMPLAQTAAEIEPFKTAVVLGFDREWPFVLYAVALLAIGLVVDRFFCRYLCPLGAALAIPARMKMFEWLKRRWQCGSQCQRCAVRCPVQAIHPDGHINPNECVYCLNCQVNYYDDRICPPLVEMRKRREKWAARRAEARAAAADAAPKPAAAAGASPLNNGSGRQ